MIRLNKSFQKTTSMALIFMIILSIFTPLFSIQTNAEEPESVVQTSTQEINDFSVSLISGITNQGTIDNPLYIFTPSVSGSEFRYQVDYTLSGSGDLAAETVQITIPKHIFKDRAGNDADRYEVAVPEASEADVDDKENDFVYVERENDILIYNRLKISAADSGSIQFSYTTTESPFEYRDMSVSEEVVSRININKNVHEHLYTQDTAPGLTIDTYARLNSTSKSISMGSPIGWNSSWGNPSDFGIDTPDDYYYLVWDVRTNVSATQPYTLSLQDTVTGENGNAEFVGVSWDGSSAYTTNLVSPERTTSGYIYSKVLTKHLKATYEPLETYRINNRVDVTVCPKDKVDPDSRGSDSAVYTYSAPQPDYPIGHFNFWKYNHYRYYYNSEVVNYQLGEFRNNEIEEISQNIDYRLDIVGYAYPWTIENGYHSSDVDHYGVNPVTYVITDDEFFFYDLVTAYDTPEGTEQLDYHDYEITKVNYDYSASDADWSTSELKFITRSPVYSNDDAIYFYAKFKEDTGWQPAGVFHLKTGVGELLSDKVASLTYTSIVFKKDAGCTGYKIVTSNAFYYTRLNAYPYCKIKHSERIDRLIETAFGQGEKRVWLTNRANTSIYSSDRENISEDNCIFTKNEYARNYIIGYEKESSINKTSTFFSNNKIKKMVTVGWQVNISESYQTQDDRVYIPQETGAFYDLLPEGADIKLSSVTVSAGNTKLRESQLDVSKIPNYQNSGRTLLVVRIKQRTDSGYTLSYSTVHSWESIFDYSVYARNSVAYETGNSTIAGGYPDDGGTINDAALLSNLDPDTDANKFLYAEHTRMMDFLLAVNTGLNKKVKSYYDESYSRETTVRQNQIYSYCLRYATNFVTKATDMIFIDNLEQFTNPDEGISNQWQGTLQAVDVSDLIEKGIAPVVYLSAQPVVINSLTDINLEDTSVWQTLDDFGDITRARAVAIDLRKDASGNDYVLNTNDSVIAYIYMKSPSSDPGVTLPEGQVAPRTHNDIKVAGRLVSAFTEEYYDDRLNYWGYDMAELRIMGDLPILKVNAKDHTTPVEGIYFRLAGTSDYGTQIDSILESDNQGGLTFKDIEKGTYKLTEYKGSPDYLKIDGIMDVIVDNEGKVTVDGTAVGDKFVIDDPPRIHTDISFNKKDLRNKYKVLAGVKFHLEGKSNYGNMISEDAVSNENGIVTFANIEYGNYTMRETETIPGYILNETVFDVRVDENANFAISDSYMEMDGTLTVYNEPLHSFTIQKEGTFEVDGIALPVGGAVFNLSGTSDYGTVVNITKTTETNGRASFDDLEAGTYILYEDSAPDGYTLDPTRRVVTITDDDIITIDGVQKNSLGYFIIKNEDNSTVIITKKWEDKYNNDTRKANPFIHLGVEQDAPVAFFNSYQDQSILGNKFGVYSVRKFAPGDETTAKARIADNTATRIDDGSTSYGIYAWLDYNTVYWWSDANKVYLDNRGHHLWYGLTSCTSIDVSDIDISFLTDMSHMFYNCQSLTTLTGLDDWDVSKVTDMSYMFYYCQKLTIVNPLADWNVSNVTDMNHIFYFCSNLTDLTPLQNWNVSNVTDMSYMFYYCQKLTIVNPLADWNVSNVRDMRDMFHYCEALTDLTPLQNWTVSNVTDMSCMFDRCYALTDLTPLQNWNVSNVTNMSCMFYYCQLTKLDGLDNWTVSNVTDMISMFTWCSQLTDLTPISGWNVSNVTDMSGMFLGCSQLTNLTPISGWDVSNVTNMSGMFAGWRNLTNLTPISGWDVSNVTNMSNMFGSCIRLSDLTPLKDWNVSNVTDMSNMFYGWKSLTNLNPISGWNVSNVTNMSGMFEGCGQLTDLTPISGWDVSNVINMSNMFSYCQKLNDLTSLASWNVSTVVDMSYMFYYCSQLSALTSLASWNLSNVTNMEYMFYYCSQLSALTSLASWNVSNVTNMECMFYYCSQISDLTPLKDWNVSTVRNMRYMFYNCSRLTDLTPLKDWDVSSVTNMQSMFIRCSQLSDLTPLKDWDVSNVTTMLQMFYGCSRLTNLSPLCGWDVSSVTNMQNMFGGCSSATTADLSGWDTSSVTNMTYLFSNCSQLVSIYVSDLWSTSKVSSSSDMFNGCTSLNSDGVATPFDSSKTDKTYARIWTEDTPGYFRKKETTPVSIPAVDYAVFKRVSNSSDSILTTVDSAGSIKQFRHYTGDDAAEVIANTTTVRLDDGTTDYSIYGWMDNGTLYWWSDADTVYLVEGALWRNLRACTYIDVSGIDVSRMTNMSYMFYYCQYLTSIEGLEDWNVSNITSMGSMFYYCQYLTSIEGLEDWNVSNVTSMDAMFYYCSRLSNLTPLEDWNVSNVTSMGSMFFGCRQLSDLTPLKDWNVSNVTSMAYMFFQCYQLSDLTPLKDWNVSNVMSIYDMFSGCSRLSDLTPLKDWNVSNVIDMARMFSYCSQLSDLTPLKDWDVSRVTNMSYMFNGCSNLITADLSGWDTSQVSNMAEMFYYCTNLKTIYVSGLWSVNKVSSSWRLFQGCTSLVGGNGTHYDSSHIDKAYARIDNAYAPGYLTYKKLDAPARMVEEIYNSSSTNCQLTKLDDTTWTYTFTGLNPTVQYYAWEDEMEGYTSLNMGQTNFLTVKNGVGTITNISDDPPTYGDLIVQKNVLNKDGTDTLTDADKSRTFLFTVTLTDSQGGALTDSMVLNTVKTSNGTETENMMVFNAGKASFRLGDDDAMTIKDIPDGYQYQVTETPEEGFDASVTKGAATGTITDEQPQTVQYTNKKNYEETEDDVTFTIQKIVTGNVIDPGETFGFTIYLENLRANGAYTIHSTKNPDKIFSASSNGVAFVELTLVHQEQLTLTVPEKTAYTITELAGAYTASYQITDSEGLNRINRSADYNTEENTALSTKSETADAGEKVAVVFTNVKDVRQKLTLQKILAAEDTGGCIRRNHRSV